MCLQHQLLDILYITYIYSEESILLEEYFLV